MKVYITKPGSKRVELIEQEHYMIQDGQIKLYDHYQDLINNEGGYELTVEYEEPVVESVEPEVPAGESDIMTRDLSISEQRAILGKLFCFDVDERGVVYDADGYEFYGFNQNCIYDLDTLEGIFDYAKEIEKESGAYDAKAAMRKVLGL